MARCATWPAKHGTYINHSDAPSLPPPPSLSHVFIWLLPCDGEQHLYDWWINNYVICCSFSHLLFNLKRVAVSTCVQEQSNAVADAERITFLDFRLLGLVDALSTAAAKHTIDAGRSMSDTQDEHNASPTSAPSSLSSHTFEYKSIKSRRHWQGNRHEWRPIGWAR